MGNPTKPVKLAGVVTTLLVGEGAAAPVVLGRQAYAVVVHRHLLVRQGFGAGAGLLPHAVRAEAGGLALAVCDLADVVRQVEIGGAIAAIVGPDQTEERGILRDGERAAVAGKPAGRAKAKCENLDLADE